jgi:prolyl-tRNA editing enzyme YbaK/EbsC (Cys-tRNA(Pro) deacylase)
VTPENPGAAAPLDLAAYLRERRLEAELVAPGVPMPSVDAAAAAMGCAPERILKSVLFQAEDGRCAMAVACGNGRVDPRRLEALTGLAGLRLARPEVVLEVTGYPAGGTPPVGHRGRFPVIVDPRAARLDWGYAGGGRPELLVRIRPADIVRLTGARVEEVVEAEGDRGSSGPAVTAAPRG